MAALFLYFRPWFRVERLIAPFLALLVLTLITPAGFFTALVFAALFYVILLVKDLLIVDRRSAYEVIILTLALLYLRHFYAAFAMGVDGVAFFWAFMVAGVVALMFRNFAGSFANEKAVPPDESDPAIGAAIIADERGREERGGRHWERAAIWLLFILLSQIMIAGLLLPLDFIYQSVIVFLAAVFLIDLFAEYITHGLVRNKILGIGSVIFILITIIIASARWWL